ncbi:MAG: sugar phosphate nucleotidyltransferase, partial [Candidatus Bathyarchaeia archaeon]
MKAVILATGRGERLSPYTDRMPKPLLPIGGRTIIEHVISSLNQAGIDDFVVVTGYLGSKVRRRLGDGGGLGVDIRYVQNPDYMRGNASSLLCAAEALENEGPFLLAMSDHLIERDIPKRALESFRGEPLLCVDKMPIYMNDVGEATKVLVDDEGYIRNIGKG